MGPRLAKKTRKVPDRPVLSPIEAEPVERWDVVPPVTSRRDIVELVENQIDESLYETFRQATRRAGPPAGV